MSFRYITVWAGCAICWVLASASAGFAAETPLQLAIQMQGKTAGITIAGEPGTPLEMEYLDAFSASNTWRFLAYIELPEASYLWMDPASPSASQRFYRAVKVPTNMVLIPEGRFQIGDNFAESYADERPVHSVFISMILLATTAIRLAWGAEIFSPPSPALVPMISFCFSGASCFSSARE